jgi:uncharacterized protein YceH (UPF0502 family)
MDIRIDLVEARVLGALVEKELTTPDYYPLTLNGLTLACNQRSARDPVMNLDEKTVARALESLRERRLTRMLSGADMRVPRHYHLMSEALDLAPPELAALAVLILRGPQTVGEIRGRSSRMHAFTDLAQTEQTLADLAGRPTPLVVELPRQPGRKEPRFAHLLCGAPELPAEGEGPVDAVTLEVRAENERLARLEEELDELRQAFQALRQEFAQFRAQFE